MPTSHVAKKFRDARLVSRRARLNAAAVKLYGLRGRISQHEHIAPASGPPHDQCEGNPSCAGHIAERLQCTAGSQIDELMQGQWFSLYNKDTASSIPLATTRSSSPQILAWPLLEGLGDHCGRLEEDAEQKWGKEA